jgi:hypothetical protein
LVLIGVEHFRKILKTKSLNNFILIIFYFSLLILVVCLNSYFRNKILLIFFFALSIQFFLKFIFLITLFLNKKNQISFTLFTISDIILACCFFALLYNNVKFLSDQEITLNLNITLNSICFITGLISNFQIYFFNFKSYFSESDFNMAPIYFLSSSFFPWILYLNLRETIYLIS